MQVSYSLSQSMSLRLQQLDLVVADPAGLAPLVLTVSECQLHTISAVGAGLLIGTALGVILPEGSEAFRTAQDETGMHKPLVLL